MGNEEPREAAVTEAAAPLKTGSIAWNPKTTPEEIKALAQNDFRDFDPLIRKPTLDSRSEESIRKQLQNRIYSLTVEQEIDNFANIRQRKIIDPIEQPQTSDAARAFLLDTVLKTASELLFNDAQPPIVQYNLVVLTAQLNSKPADIGARPPKPPIPYLPAQKPLMQVLTSPSFPIYCRIMAAQGIQRLLRDGELSNRERGDLGQALAAVLEEEIDRPVGAQWFYFRIVEALGVTGRLDDVGRNPVIIDSLLKTLANRKRDWVVRAAAARAISQLPFEQSTNVELINHEIGKLCLQLSEAYNASDKKTDSQWRWSFATIYLSYKPASEADQKQRRWGLMFQATQRGQAQVQALYKVMLPIMKGTIESTDGRLVPPAQIKALADWLAMNKPADRKATPASQDLKEAAASDDQSSPMTLRPGTPGNAITGRQ